MSKVVSLQIENKFADMTGEISSLQEKIEKGYRVGYQEALALIENVSVSELCELADELRRHYNGNYIDTCSIMNARSGKCSENCKWCSQSVFHKTNIEIYPLVGKEAALKEAAYNAGKGVRRFSLVTSGRTMSDSDIEKVCDIYKNISSHVSIKLCASMGLLNKEQLQKLKDSGVERYHCNMETAPSYFAQLCTTHTPEEKMQTIKWAKEVGLEVCSGGIIGMGENEEHRVELAVTLQKLGVTSIPLNILNPIKGTALENMPPLKDEEILRAIAIMRIVNPEADIRLAGGRTLIKHIEEKTLKCGVSAMIVGDMLTTTGAAIDTDKAMFLRNGYRI